jgi:hypothetical protein
MECEQILKPPPMFTIEAMKPESEGEHHGSQEASKKSGKKRCEEG